MVQAANRSREFRAPFATLLSWALQGCMGGVAADGTEFHLYGRCKSERFEEALARAELADPETCGWATVLATDPTDSGFAIAAHTSRMDGTIEITDDRERAAVAVLQGMSVDDHFHCALFPDQLNARRAWWAVQGSLTFTSSGEVDTDDLVGGTPEGFRGDLSMRDVVITNGIERCEVPDVTWSDGQFGQISE